MGTKLDAADNITYVRVLVYRGNRINLEKHLSQCYARGKRVDALGTSIEEIFAGEFRDAMQILKEKLDGTKT